MLQFNVRKLLFLLILPLHIGVFGQEFFLDHLSTYATGIFDESAAEIAAYDAATQRVFYVNGDNKSIEVLDISDPSNPVFINTIDVSAFGDGANSVAVRDGIVAAAVEADPSTDPGLIVFFDTDGNFLNSVPAGVLPDMLAFTPDGSKVLSANEGEPNDDYDLDPEGSVTIVDISNGVANATATQVGFGFYNDKKASLLNKGVRIFGPGATVAQDLEPEYVTFSNDGSLAYVICQENNALLVVDIEGGELLDILALGTKDHSAGSFNLQERFLNQLPNWPELGTPLYGGDPVQLGGFSGLYFDPTQSNNNQWVFYTIPDRGPNDGAIDNDEAGTSQNLRPFKLPNYQARIVKFTYNRASGQLIFDESEQIFLTRQDGTTPISGRGNIPGFDEVPVTQTDGTVYTQVDYSINGVDYTELPYDEFGGDFEGIVRDADGNFWMCDEYRPAIYQFASNGTLINRFVPKGTSVLGDAPLPAGTYGAETLPAVYSKRRANRGFEAIALDTDEGILYAFIQTPLYNPDNSTRNNSDVIRVLGIDPATGERVREYVYLLERNQYPGVGLSRLDKIGDAVYVGKGKFRILERDSGTPDDGNTSKKFIFEFTLDGATDISELPIADKMTSTGPDDKTLEMMSADDLEAMGIKPVFKTKILNLPSIGYLPSDKPEGLAIAPGNRMIVLNDNDFGLAGAGVTDNSDLGIINVGTNNGFDASNEDDNIEIWPRPTQGFYMPDAIASYDVDGKTYIVTANEGDARDYDGYSEEDRVKDLNLNPDYFPNAFGLQDEENLGRLNTTLANGDINGDGLHEIIYSYGARSFSIWDEFGNLVYDSGNDFEKNLSVLAANNFNSNNDDNDSRKARSDDKGPEPEAVEIVPFNGKIYALIGLERQGGIMVYDVSNPFAPRYIDYFQNRNFAVDAESVDAGDLGVEDILYIPADDSPTGRPLVVTANEVSGTISIFGIADPGSRFSLQILHNNDAESQLINAGSGDLEDVGGIARFKLVVDSLRYVSYVDGNPTILLSSGDNFIPGPEFNASLALGPNEPFYDALAVKTLRYDALCIGNHDFDFGPDVLEKFINDTENPGGFPKFLSANLDFSGEPGLQNLKDAGRIASSQVLWRGTEKIGVIGLTTPNLPFISSPGEVTVNSALASIVQSEVNNLENQGVNKIILISHLQSINEEVDLAAQVTGVDVIIAGGGDEFLTNNPADTLPGLSVDGPYPRVETDAEGEDVYLVTTPGEYRYVGNLVVTFDENGKVINVDDSSNPVKVVTNRPNQFMQTNIVDPVAAFVAGLAQNIIAVSEVDLDGIRNNVRTFETNQGNLIADALLWQANELAPDFNVAPADVALQNGGGIRNNSIIPAGDISELTTFDMLPFSNFVTIIDALSPAEFKDVLENAVSKVEDVSGRFAQIAGFELVYDPDGTAMEIDNDGNITTQGSRVINVTLDDGTPIVQNGAVVPGAPSVRIATIDFLARGGDQYPYGNTGFTLLGTSYQQALANYLQGPLDGLVTEADYPFGGEGRITTFMQMQQALGGRSSDYDNATEKVETSFHDLYAYPNPFNNHFILDFQLKETQEIEVYMVDVEGKRVATLFEGVQEAGQHQVTFSEKSGELATGNYFVVLRSNEGNETLSVSKK